LLSTRKTKGEGKGHCCPRGRLEEKERVTVVYKENEGECSLRGKLKEKERVTDAFKEN
jgi:hypothetical protein